MRTIKLSVQRGEEISEIGQTNKITVLLQMIRDQLQDTGLGEILIKHDPPKNVMTDPNQ